MSTKPAQPPQFRLAWSQKTPHHFPAPSLGQVRRLRSGVVLEGWGMFCIQC